MQEDQVSQDLPEDLNHDEGSDAAGTPPGAGTGPEDPVAALEAARAESTAHWERYLRTAAELENVRRRAARELENAHKYALEKFAAALLAVKDSLEMGMDAAGADIDAESLRAGMATTLKQLEQVFGQSGITEIAPAPGTAFDPELHEAMTVQETDEVAPDCVLNVVQKGYELNGRLLRAARVIVSRAGES